MSIYLKIFFEDNIPTQSITR